MPLNLKITWGAGASSARLLGLDDGITLSELKGVIAEKSGIETHRAQLKAGFPPKDVSGSDADPVVSLGITSGSALTVLERKAPPSPTPTPTQPSPSPPPPSSVPSPPSSAAARRTTSVSAAPPAPPQLQRRQEPAVDPALVQSLVDMGFEQGFAAKALEVAGGDINTAVEICMSGDPAALGSDSGRAASTATAARIMVRRIIDADNSCLFNAVGYALRRKRKVGTELRQMITEAVRGSPEVYNEGILGKQPEEYCNWISDPKSWGGEIELSILSKKLVVMITVVDIQTNNAYSYGEEHGFGRRLFIIYDGIHYDALAEAANETAPESDDVTVFNPSEKEKEILAKTVAADLKARNQYTDMGNASLKCMVCFKLLAGEKGALEHARATGHQNFGQV
ncbi:OTU-like cysteine protease [Ectocarpus siliculosus]|uniref:Ubiquitin thioesterase OTU n=1 Tax=Ectocarpus siliculosus TaxID=2880 RepID=D7G1R6_ECTSI|nr:OTU-like cysteine protease [Ectocarpus siliculosus]|eukprot:CBJ33311.1 OTU-like cysteine protease [Ectocarpus siliculosus]